jgi:hypothetical protein
MDALVMDALVAATQLQVAATPGGQAWELSALAVAWGAATWWAARWLTRGEAARHNPPPASSHTAWNGSSLTWEGPASSPDDAGHPVVRRTNPRRPIRASSPVESTSATRTTAAGIVAIDGVMAARKPSLT